jgi:hypothetical protein
MNKGPFHIGRKGPYSKIIYLVDAASLDASINGV